MVEAGTGTGKSLAYLIPAAQWLQNGERVVVSTNTIALQDQLINKDLPDLIEALDSDLRTAVLKGRSNYLCPRKLNALRKRGPENADELRILAKILVWLHQGGSGDRAEINLNGPIERMIWARLSAEDENCRIETCLRQMGGRCPFYKARMAAESAHILVVNHALLLADAATENRVLPAYNYLILTKPTTSKPPLPTRWLSAFTRTTSNALSANWAVTNTACWVVPGRLLRTGLDLPTSLS